MVGALDLSDLDRSSFRRRKLIKWFFVLLFLLGTITAAYYLLVATANANYKQGYAEGTKNLGDEIYLTAQTNIITISENTEETKNKTVYCGTKQTIMQNPEITNAIAQKIIEQITTMKQ